jgi:hypothetical protein
LTVFVSSSFLSSHPPLAVLARGFGFGGGVRTLIKSSRGSTSFVAPSAAFCANVGRRASGQRVVTVQQPMSWFRRRSVMLSVSTATVTTAAAASKSDDESPIFSIDVPTLDGKTTTLKEFKGDVLLIVNVASA